MKILLVSDSHGYDDELKKVLENVKCEILKPNFIKISPEINIKDYVGVNSAISLALSGIGQGISGMNFKKTTLIDKLPDFLKIEVGGKNRRCNNENGCYQKFFRC